MKIHQLRLYSLTHTLNEEHLRLGPSRSEHFKKGKKCANANVFMHCASDTKIDVDRKYTQPERKWA